MTIYKLAEVDLDLFDDVVSAVSHQGYIIVITKRGLIFKIDPEQT